jgi:chorismate mutase
VLIAGEQKFASLHNLLNGRSKMKIGENDAEDIACENFSELLNDVMTESRIARFRDNVIEMANDAGFDGEEIAKQFDRLIEQRIEEQKREQVRNDDPDEEPEDGFEPYFAILIPWVPEDERTEWHPTEQFGQWSVLTRGAFATAKEARQWAREHLNGNPYRVIKR